MGRQRRDGPDVFAAADRVAAAIRDNPGWTDREVSQACRVPPNGVRVVRSGMARAAAPFPAMAAEFYRDPPPWHLRVADPPGLPAVLPPQWGEDPTATGMRVVAEATRGEGRIFDEIRQTDEDGEFWSARDLAPRLGYAAWKQFPEAVSIAAKTAEEQGFRVADHIGATSKMIPLGKGATRAVADWRLSRFGCLLVAQASDHRKAEVKQARTYFAVQTHRAETLLPPVTAPQPAPAPAVAGGDMRPVLDAVMSLCKSIAGLAEGQQAILAEFRAGRQTAPTPAAPLPLPPRAVETHFRVRGYASLRGQNMNDRVAAEHGRALSKICKARGLTVEKQDDKDYGKVNAYPVEVLREYGDGLGWPPEADAADC